MKEFADYIHSNILCNSIKKKKEEDDLYLQSTSEVMTESALTHGWTMVFNTCLPWYPNIDEITVDEEYAIMNCVHEAIEDEVEKSLFFIPSPEMKSSSQCMTEEERIPMVCPNPSCRRMQYFDATRATPHSCKYCNGLQRFVGQFEGENDRSEWEHGQDEVMKTVKHYDLEMLPQETIIRNGVYEEGQVDEFEEDPFSQTIPSGWDRLMNRINKFGRQQLWKIAKDVKEQDIWSFQAEGKKVRILGQPDMLVPKSDVYVSTYDDFSDVDFMNEDSFNDISNPNRIFGEGCKSGCGRYHAHSKQTWRCDPLRTEKFWVDFYKARENLIKKQENQARKMTAETEKWVKIYLNKFGLKVSQEDLDKVSEYNGKGFTWGCNVKVNPKANPTNAFTTFIKSCINKSKSADTEEVSA